MTKRKELGSLQSWGVRLLAILLAAVVCAVVTGLITGINPLHF